MKNIELQLETLTCPSCVKKIETVLSKTKGVNKAEVLFNSSVVQVEYDGTLVDETIISKKINDLGFEVLG